MITLHWLPNSDGGHEQMFVIQYRIKDMREWQDTVAPVKEHASTC